MMSSLRHRPAGAPWGDSSRKSGWAKRDRELQLSSLSRNPTTNRSLASSSFSSLYRLLCLNRATGGAAGRARLRAPPANEAREKSQLCIAAPFHCSALTALVVEPFPRDGIDLSVLITCLNF
uniref:Uncharacterized protein n=1 Tax=Plectus sambesii TaxID=2011161 RepID=A0A914VXF5_9BILA